MKKWGVKKTQLYDLLKNKHLLETKLAESPVRSANSQEQTELEDQLDLCCWMKSKERQGLLLEAEMFKIQTQAKNIAKEMHFSRLQFTDSWFRGLEEEVSLDSFLLMQFKKFSRSLIQIKCLFY